jgi:hypothetical protein
MTGEQMAISEKVKKVFKWLKWILLIVGSAFAGIVIGKITEKAIVREVDKKKNWAYAGGNTIAIFDKDEYIIKKVLLPVNPETGKQLDYKDIAAVGMPLDGGKVHVEIKHNPTDRH